MIVFPNAKINIGLNITEKRSDGYHNLNTLFFPIGLTDVLEIIPSGEMPLTFTQSGITLPQNTGDNLVEMACKLMMKKAPLPNISVHLHKHIPFGAGLGGGSADAAFALKAMNNMFQLGLSNEELRQMSRGIGADCPFFIENVPSYARGIGDELSKSEIDLKGLYLVLIKPDIVVPTAKAYKYIQPKVPKEYIKDIISKPLSDWRGCLVNDFELSVFKEFPAIERIKNVLYDNGAVYASMSGSGSSVYGLFQEKVNLKHLFASGFYFSQKL